MWHVRRRIAVLMKMTNAMQNTSAFPAPEPVHAVRPSAQALSVIAGMKHSVKM